MSRALGFRVEMRACGFRVSWFRVEVRAYGFRVADRTWPGRLRRLPSCMM